MEVILKSGASNEEIARVEEILHQKKNSGGFDAKKYNGIMPSDEDPLTIQKRLRDEWERNPR